MRPVSFPPEKILDLFRVHKVLTKEDIFKACGCANMTLWKILHDYGYLTSYNFNAMYYTLFDIPTFDELGLWSYKKIRFSRYGSISQTLVELIERSEAGYTAKELSGILDVQVAPELSRLHGLRRVQRERLGSSFVYLASVESHRRAQIEERQAQIQKVMDEAALPSPEITIAVLVELVQHPGTPPQALAKRLKRRKVPVSEKDVQDIFTRYDLAGKKGL